MIFRERRGGRAESQLAGFPVVSLSLILELPFAPESHSRSPPSFHSPISPPAFLCFMHQFIQPLPNPLIHPSTHLSDSSFHFFICLSAHPPINSLSPYICAFYLPTFPIICPFNHHCSNHTKASPTALLPTHLSTPFLIWQMQNIQPNPLLGFHPTLSL